MGCLCSRHSDGARKMKKCDSQMISLHQHYLYLPEVTMVSRTMMAQSKLNGSRYFEGEEKVEGAQWRKEGWRELHSRFRLFKSVRQMSGQALRRIDRCRRINALVPFASD